MSQTRDPLSELIYSKNDYGRRILSEEEQVLTRMECSFYGNSLKVIEEYTKFISSILPNWNKVARRVNNRITSKLCLQERKNMEEQYS